MRISTVSLRSMILALSVTIPIGCTTYDHRDFKNIDPPKKAESRLGAAVLIYNKCPMATDSSVSDIKTGLQAQNGQIHTLAGGAGVAAAVAPLAANFAVTLVGKALAERKAGLAGEFSAGGIGEDITGKATGCLIVARGHFGDRFAKAGKFSKELLEKLSLAAHPVFYLEAEVDKTGDNIELKPVYLSYAASSARNSGSGWKNVSLAIAMSKAAVDKDARSKGEKADSKEDKPFAVFRHNIGRLEIGKVYKGEKMLSGTSYVQGSANFSKQKEKFNITAQITESEDASIALEALIEAFGAKKGGIETLITDTIKEGIENGGK
uniref:Uncharacterized protein n=1 Tax=Candidatus Kentrum sp. UNK TaxID=2126344 RepID=A0A451B2Y0_9GAMM|nr:MAG: hypothetical protein BECKUNK1418G_GA0071005_11346 [Candidatus Kentron sp. UNK]VFK72623.1 MAG: hypothetical protein BECKUNK1418H_GA0071006_11266 [Candidatus Kentron sp. UNK]